LLGPTEFPIFIASKEFIFVHAAFTGVSKYQVTEDVVRRIGGVLRVIARLKHKELVPVTKGVREGDSDSTNC